MGRIAAKPRSQQWSKFLNENHQKLTFREGVQPWDLARFSRRIESYRFIMESSKSEPYSASYDFLAWCQAGSGSQHLLQIYADLKSVQIWTSFAAIVCKGGLSLLPVGVLKLGGGTSGMTVQGPSRGRAPRPEATSP